MYKQFNIAVITSRGVSSIMVTALSHINACNIVRRYGYICA